MKDLFLSLNQHVASLVALHFTFFPHFQPQALSFDLITTLVCPADGNSVTKKEMQGWHSVCCCILVLFMHL